MKSYYSSGKLLLTGEYIVLDGALSLAIPTQYGQHLLVEETKGSTLVWQSLDEHQNVWFETEFEIKHTKITKNVDDEISNRLFEILQAAQQLNSEFLNTTKGYKITTILEFPKYWGLGTSSTLINNIALWAQVDAFTLLDMTFGGSGYDIACAQHDSAITYQLIQNDNKRLISQVIFNPEFKAHLYFVYLNRKQDSREGISQYKKHASNLSEVITEINSITNNMLTCKTLDDFNILIEKHEQIIAKIINQDPIKERFFSDFNGSIKSLGAWGGDFILASCKTNPTDYFNRKGFETILCFDEMVAGDF